MAGTFGKSRLAPKSFGNLSFFAVRAAWRLACRPACPPEGDGGGPPASVRPPEDARVGSSHLNIGSSLTTQRISAAPPEVGAKVIN